MLSVTFLFQLEYATLEQILLKEHSVSPVVLLHVLDKQFRQQSTKLLIMYGFSVGFCVIFVLAFRRI